MNDVIIETTCERWSSADRPLFKGKLISDDGCCCAQGDVLRHAGWDDDELLNVYQYKADHEVARILGVSLTHSILLRQVNDSVDGCPQDVLLDPSRILGDQTPRVLAFWHRLDGLSNEDWKGIAASSAAANPATWADAWEVASAASATANDAAIAAYDAAIATYATWADAWEVANAASATANAATWASNDAAIAAYDAAIATYATARDAWAAKAASAAVKAAAKAAKAAKAANAARDASAAAGATNEIQGHEVMKANGCDLFFLPMFGINDVKELDLK